MKKRQTLDQKLADKSAATKALIDDPIFNNLLVAFKATIVEDSIKLLDTENESDEPNNRRSQSERL